MLTKDLLRIGVKKGEVSPRFLPVSSDTWIGCAQDLIDAFVGAEGSKRAALNDEVNRLTGSARDFKVRRGLAKLLRDRTEFVVDSALNPSLVRQTVFELASPHQPIDATSRLQVLDEAARVFETHPDRIEAALYADLESNHRVGALKPISAVGLLHRYNVALVQGVLLRSPSLRLTVQSPTQKRLRQLIRYLKFYRLTHSARRFGTDWQFTIDGPLSVIKQSSRYGMALANFFPALLLAEQWSLEAEYKATPKARTAVLQLSSEVGLVSHYRDTGTWTADEEDALIERLAELAPDWDITAGGDLIDLDGMGVVVPDITLTSPDGVVVQMEVIWRWRGGDLQARWEHLAKTGTERFILAVSTAHAARLPNIEGPVHRFKGTPNARSILKLARELCE